MNNLEFIAVLEQKRHLAVELVRENVRALRGEENKFSEALSEYYQYVYGALYDENAPQYFIEPILEDIRFGEVNESRLIRFWTKKDGVDVTADKLWLAVDNCEIDW